MELSGARILVVGATGVLGGRISRGLADRGAKLALAGRDRRKLIALARELGGCQYKRFDAYDVEGCPWLVRDAHQVLGGLQGVVVCSGIVAFGTAENTHDVVSEQLFAVNTLAPIAILRTALPVLHRGSAIAAITGVESDRPAPELATYSASKAALSAWLAAVRQEQRPRGVTVLDAKLPHVDTGMGERAAAGRRPNRLGRGADPQYVVDRMLDALASGAEEIRVGPDGRTLEAA
ncbi:SDR family NAD(P)-dependent oxidoreductase [Crossiella cryophila]|uniref:Short-subunit dehydrogenase n=1 Tax=Crossiella cryophila TaxID=43355 RepID=A0A7W7CGB4_9PSEU|nr:SDR family NAD(P)-dependent oxidoreductase [Crossiella cryophila]MBB4680725.1 short-subunit dehydrogenase [Crossiella cryophila]